MPKKTRTRPKVISQGIFDEDHDLIDFQMIERLMQLGRVLVKYFRTSLSGLENLPKNKGALLISNHSIMGIDSIILFCALYDQTHRALRGLGEHFFFKNPKVGQFMMKIGMVDGNRDNAVSLLKAGKWTLAYPAGVKESFSHYSKSYQLHWKDRLGYLRCALAANVPIIPFASIGADESYVTIGHEPWIDRKLGGSKKYDLPIMIGLGAFPLPVKFRYVFDKPIHLKKRFGLTQKHASASNSKLLPAHEAIWNQTQVLIDEELNKRKSRFF